MTLQWHLCYINISIYCIILWISVYQIKGLIWTFKPRILHIKCVSDIWAEEKTQKKPKCNILVWSCNVSSSPPVGALDLQIIFQSKFSVPVHPDSQFGFAFEFEDRGYTFTRMPQGYCETSIIYSDAVRRSLEPVALTERTAVETRGWGIFGFLIPVDHSHRPPMKEMDARLLFCCRNTVLKWGPLPPFLAKLDPLVVGFPRCLRAVAAAEKAAMASREFVGYFDLIHTISQQFCTNKKPPISPKLAGLKLFFSPPARLIQCHR